MTVLRQDFGGSSGAVRGDTSAALMEVCAESSLLIPVSVSRSRSRPRTRLSSTSRCWREGPCGVLGDTPHAQRVVDVIRDDGSPDPSCRAATADRSSRTSGDGGRRIS